MRDPRLSPAAFLLAASFVGCKSIPPPPPADYTRPLPPGQVALEKLLDPSQYPDFSAGFEDRDALVRGIDESLAYYAKPSSKKWFPYLDVTHERAVESLKAFRATLLQATSGADLDRRIRERFEVYRSVGWDGSGTVLFTAYCEPIVKGSRVQTAEYRHPLYRRPPDLVRTSEGVSLGRRTPEGQLASYYTREEIDRGNALRGRGLELVWLADPFDAYVIHVQGSGRVSLPDGSEMKVGFAGKTDHPYTSVGRALVGDGRIPRDELSLARMREHFRANPKDLDDYLARNASYVFFTEHDGGPYGSLGVPVTPMHTIATDKEVYPRGAVAFVQTQLPSVRGERVAGQEAWAGFALDQDTGGAIRSAGRCDLFLGSGDAAEFRAGHTWAEGRLHYLFVKPGLATPAPLADP
jgi:membrane-bound lytic murein transglycosylase A